MTVGKLLEELMKTYKLPVLAGRVSLNRAMETMSKSGKRALVAKVGVEHKLITNHELRIAWKKSLRTLANVKSRPLRLGSRISSRRGLPLDIVSIRGGRALLRSFSARLTDRLLLGNKVCVCDKEGHTSDSPP